MKKRKTIYLLNEEELEAETIAAMADIDFDKASLLLENMDMSDIALEDEYIPDIKKRTFEKLNLQGNVSANYNKLTENNPPNNSTFRKKFYRKIYAAAIAIIIIAIFAGFNRNRIVLAFQEMLSLIPGVGIVEDNREAIYRLKEQVSSQNEQSTLKILYATGTADSLTIRFDLEGFHTEKQDTMKNRYKKLKVNLLVEDQKYTDYQGGTGAGLSGNKYSYNCDYTFTIDERYMNTGNLFTLELEDYDIRVSFRLSQINHYSSPDDIGATDIHNNISLTADAFRKDGQLTVNIYPLNNSDYNLISFNQEYDLTYFGEKMTLSTDKGVKDYTPPNYYGTGLNAPFLFDVSDGSTDFKLTIPFVAVETDEEKEITLPVPEEGEKAFVDKELGFEDGTLLIKQVERLSGDTGNEYGYLKIYLDYKSSKEEQQLVSVNFTAAGEAGFYYNFDLDNRLTAVSYLLKDSDTTELNLIVNQPRYVLLEPYQLDINIK